MRFSLRPKLALVSLLLLFVPFAGLRFSELIKQDLMESRKQAIQFSARAVASALSGRTGLFENELFHYLNARRDLYIFKLSNPIRLNGEVDDWQPQLDEAIEYGKQHLIFSARPFDSNSLHYKQLIGTRGDYLYILFLVSDDTIVYRRKNSLRVDLSDHLQIGIEDPQGKLHRYTITTAKPGWVNGFLMDPANHLSIPEKIETKIQGMWVESQDGYIVELRLPVEMVGQKLAFAVADVDDPITRETINLIGTSGANKAEELGWLLPPSPAIETILQPFDRPNSKILIVDSNHRVRASHGTLSHSSVLAEKPTSLLSRFTLLCYNFFSPLYRIFTSSFTSQFDEESTQPTTLDLAGITEALNGTPSITSYTLEDHDVQVMAALEPIKEGDQVIGAVVVEQTTNSILALQNRVIEESLTLTIIAFITGGLGLVFFASRLSSRIRALGSQAAAAIDQKGQIQLTIPANKVGDEIGDLARTLTTMLYQLQAQTRFREQMADNLEHEIRTPLAGISASINNLVKELESPADHITNYLNWALADLARVEKLLSAIRDATNLRDALLKDQKENFDVDKAIEVWLAKSWRPAFPDAIFHYTPANSNIMLLGDPMRIHQMLDKLIENAVSFHTPGTPIEITLGVKTGRLQLTIANRGPTIPSQLHNQIFNSMVSHRPKMRSGQHLGLGLYIVRTIVEQYDGDITITPHPDGPGAVFHLSLNISK